MSASCPSDHASQHTTGRPDTIRTYAFALGVSPHDIAARVARRSRIGYGSERRNGRKHP